MTAVLVLDSLFLILLVLVQLPKKEAGLGQAFGASATDALFGAGSGNALTKMTKYSTGIFFALTLVIYLMYNHHARSGAGAFGKRVQQAGREVDTMPPKAEETKTPAVATTNPTAGALGTMIGTNASATASIPKSKDSNVAGLLTVPQAAPSSTKTSAPAAETTTKPAPPPAK